MIHLWVPGLSDFGGGINVFSRELARTLVSEGHDVRLFAKHDREHSWEGSAVTGCGAAPAWLRTEYFACRLLASASARRPSLIIATLLNFAAAARLAKRLLGVPYILVAHGIDVHPGLSRSRVAALRNADGVWAVSHWTEARLAGLGRIPGSISVVGNTVDDNRFTTATPDASLRSRYGLNADHRVILTVGRLSAAEAYKGYDQVIRSLREIRKAVASVRYLVVGSGDDRQRAESLAADLGVADLVTFCGFVPDEELPAHYRLADVFAMPSRGEGFGIVFLEAMACGTPVLAGNADGSVDALGAGELGELVDPGDCDQITAGLVRLLQRRGPAWWYDREALRQRMLARHGREVFRKRVREALQTMSEPGGERKSA